MIHIPTIEIEGKPQSLFMDRHTIMRTLGISKSTLQRWMNDKGLKYYKVSRRVFFKTEDFNDWLESYRMEKSNG